MESIQAEEHLQTIRTLMERSAIYRRALAPIMILCGVLGLAGGIAGWALKLNSDRGFILLWSGLALFALIGSFLLARRQALRDFEPFWSPPTRRVAQALGPPLAVGCFINALIVHVGGTSGLMIFTVAIWAWLYGCALHSAGFFMIRGIKLFGLIFIALGCAVFLFAFNNLQRIEQLPAHLVMSGVFGGLHLAYGIYLYFTEQRRNET